MYVPGIFHGVRFVENERHADRHDCFLLDVFCWGFLRDCFLFGVFRYVFLHECFLLRVFRCVFPHSCFLLRVFRCVFLDECFSPHIFHHAVLYRLLIIPIIGDCEQHSPRSTFAAVFV